jgi:regulator of sigma E protease
MASELGGAVPFPICNAYRQGLRNEDIILKLDSTPVTLFHEAQAYLKEHNRSAVTFHVMRGEKILEFNVAPHDTLFGIAGSYEYLKQKIDYGFFESFGVGAKAAFTEAWNNIKGLKAMISGRVNASKSVSGPIGIAGIYGKAFKRGGWMTFWTLTAMLSMVLAVMNLLPIPVLDGGHVVILCIEGIIGRELPIKLKEIIMMVGFVMVALLMLFILGNDILNLFR